MYEELDQPFCCGNPTCWGECLDPDDDETSFPPEARGSGHEY